MDRVVVAGVLIAAAVALAWVLRRRRTEAPTRSGWAVPAQIDRHDFPSPERDWLVAAFTSSTCDTCAALVGAVSPLGNRDGVAFADIERSAAQAIHDRYNIDAVPTLIVADANGVVRASVVGPLGPEDLAHLTNTLGTRDAG